MSHSAETPEHTAGRQAGEEMPAEPAHDALSVVVGPDGALVVVGDIDLAGGPILEAQITDAAARAGAGEAITIDLDAVAFIDSSGLRSLLSASRDASERGARLTLRSPSAGVLRLLGITGTDDQFDIEPGR